MKYTTWHHKEGFLLTTDKSKIDLEKLHLFLSQHAYWSIGIPKDVVIKSIENSINFSLLSTNLVSKKDNFIGYARLITDFATFAYLGDVFIVSEFRNQGLGSWMVAQIMNWEETRGLRRWVLFTKDAHKLYQKFGWKAQEDCEKLMIYNNADYEGLLVNGFDVFKNKKHKEK